MIWKDHFCHKKRTHFFHQKCFSSCLHFLNDELWSSVHRLRDSRQCLQANKHHCLTPEANSETPSGLSGILWHTGWSLAFVWQLSWSSNNVWGLVSLTANSVQSVGLQHWIDMMDRIFVHFALTMRSCVNYQSNVLLLPRKICFCHQVKSPLLLRRWYKNRCLFIGSQRIFTTCGAAASAA